MNADKLISSIRSYKDTKHLRLTKDFTDPFIPIRSAPQSWFPFTYANMASLMRRSLRKTNRAHKQLRIAWTGCKTYIPCAEKTSIFLNATSTSNIPQQQRWLPFLRRRCLTTTKSSRYRIQTPKRHRDHRPMHLRLSNLTTLTNPSRYHQIQTPKSHPRHRRRKHELLLSTQLR
jgi:hypothetical protein